MRTDIGTGAPFRHRRRSYRARYREKDQVADPQSTHVPRRSVPRKPIPGRKDDDPEFTLGPLSSSPKVCRRACPGLGCKAISARRPTHLSSIPSQPHRRTDPHGSMSDLANVPRPKGGCNGFFGCKDPGPAGHPFAHNLRFAAVEGATRPSFVAGGSPSEGRGTR